MCLMRVWCVSLCAVSVCYECVCVCMHILRGGFNALGMYIHTLLRNTGELVKWKQRLHCRSCVNIVGILQMALF